MTTWTVPGFALLITGIVLIGLGVPLVRGKVARNTIYGYRIGRTLRDDRVWYPVNALSGIWMIWAGGLAAVIGVLLLALRNRDEAAQLVIGIGVPALIVCLALGIYRSWKLAVSIDAALYELEQSRADRSDGSETA